MNKRVYLFGSYLLLLSFVVLLLFITHKINSIEEIDSIEYIVKSYNRTEKKFDCQLLSSNDSTKIMLENQKEFSLLQSDSNQIIDFFIKKDVFWDDCSLVLFIFNSLKVLRIWFNGIEFKKHSFQVSLIVANFNNLNLKFSFIKTSNTVVKLYEIRGLKQFLIGIKTIFDYYNSGNNITE